MPPITQSVPCNTRSSCQAFKKHFKTLPKCHVCLERHSGSCRFKGCRTIDIDSGTLSFKYTVNKENPQFRQVFNRPITPEDADLKMGACAQILLPELLEERKHTRQPNLIRRTRELGTRVTCDVCQSTLFTQCWFCSTCGRELCGLCVRERKPNTPAAPCSFHCLLPISRFEDQELDDLIQVMESCLIRFRHQDVSTYEFRRYLSRGTPVVVTGIKMQGRWDPEYFMRAHGDKKVTIVDCETGKTRLSSVANFFKLFGQTDGRTNIWKLKDWPPEKDFAQVFPELFEDFENAIPFPDITRLDGVLNIGAHFPRNGIVPDLGPKLYNANGSIQDDHHSGSTCLHMDITYALNVMLWSANLPGGKIGYAVWHIFLAADAPKLRDFLRNHAGFTGLDDPIHSQTIYMTPKLLQLLFDECGIRPFTIYQRPGEAVFIPVGCAHQVSNAADSIKAACDFLPVEDLKQTLQVASELRLHRLCTGHGQDVLQLLPTLYYTIVALRELQSKFFVGRLSRDDYSPTMTADSLPVSGVNLPALATESSNNYNNDYTAPIAMNDSNTTTTVHPKTLRKREKNRIKRLTWATEACPCKGPRSKLGSESRFACPLCPREFIRCGIIDHLKTTHRDEIRLNQLIQEEPRLRKPRKIGDSDLDILIKSFVV